MYYAAINSYATYSLYRTNTGNFSTSTTDLGTMYYVHTDHLGSYNVCLENGERNTERRMIEYSCTFCSHTFILYPFILYPFILYPFILYPLSFHPLSFHPFPVFPVIARFFSPDPFVQMPDFTQNYNRYSYCLNNPLSYTDPSGEIVITFLVNAIIGWSKGENGWKSGGNAVANHFKIIGGLFTTDKNRKGGGQLWEFISRFTWQGIQTAVGHVYSQFSNMVGQIDNVSYKAGTTVMSGNFWGTGSAITIGNYIHGNSSLKPEFDNWLFQHEYGHYLQSQAVGPLYLQRYGLPSAFSGGIFDGNHKYHPAEQDANARALKYLNKHNSGFADDGSWNFSSNPIIGYDENLSIYDSQNQLALKYAKLQPAWHDWVLGPNILLSGLAINPWVLNSKKRHHSKLDRMRLDGFDIDDWYYNFEY